MHLITRKALGWPASAAPDQKTAKGVKVHYLGEPVSTKVAKDHSLCISLWKSVRASHLANVQEGYSDIAYNYGACVHGYALEGRGIGKRTGANGNQDLNKAHYAVCALIGSTGLTEPTDELLNAIKDAIEELQGHGAGKEIKGHKDGYATACPGADLYAWVQKGAPRPGASAPAGTYTVKTGDTLSGIGRALHLDWEDLAKANSLKSPYVIHPGQKLKLPGNTPAPAKPKFEPFPGASFFMNGSKPALGKSSPIFTAMGQRLCDKGFRKYYSVGPGPKLGQADVHAYEAFQRACGFSGADAKWPPGLTTWTKLQVPNV
ncbi:peptidoglycan-binding protein [Streptomyces sp. NPDC003343]